MCENDSYLVRLRPNICKYSCLALHFQWRHKCDLMWYEYWLKTIIAGLSATRVKWRLRFIRWKEGREDCYSVSIHPFSSSFPQTAGHFMVLCVLDTWININQSVFFYLWWVFSHSLVLILNPLNPLDALMYYFASLKNILYFPTTIVRRLMHIYLQIIKAIFLALLLGWNGHQQRFFGKSLKKLTSGHPPPPPPFGGIGAINCYYT